MPAEDLAQAIGEYCHTKYMGCNKARNTGWTNYDYDYCYTDEVVNMADEFFKTDEGKEALQKYIQETNNAPQHNLPPTN